MLEQEATHRAELAASKASSIASGHSAGTAYLQPLLREARLQLEVLHAVEILQKATAAYKSLHDLPKLEAAIIAARKIKGVDPEVLR